MSDQFALSPGQWVRIRDPKEYRAGDKRRVLRAIKDNESQGEVALSMMDAILVVAVEEWSLPLPLPSADIKVLDLMSIPDYDKLTDLIAPAQEALFPDAPEETHEQVADEASPTEPSDAS